MADDRGQTDSGNESKPEFEPTQLADNDFLESGTGFAPSLPAAAPSGPAVPVSVRPVDHIEIFEPGHAIDDFVIDSILGKGAFAVVYLARELSLDRLVALKVGLNMGVEGRTMAQLEHDHVVQVFGEKLDKTGTLRLLWMQYVPGATLESVVREVAANVGGLFDGKTVLGIVDRLNSNPPQFDPLALRDRVALSECDELETVCWIGERLADALGHAHLKGSLHRDIKPANILQSQYGRPLLADFNLSLQTLNEEERANAVFGGTLAYMAPEHVRAFDSSDPTTTDSVDARSDVYSLAVVLFQLLHRKLPFALPPNDCGASEAFAQLIEQREDPTGLSFPDDESFAQDALNQTLLKALQPNPEDRFQSASELSTALAGCRELRTVERKTSPANRMEAGVARFESARNYPVIALFLAAVLPHVLASVVNILYNTTRIKLTADQAESFVTLMQIYNAIVWPLGLFWLGRTLWPFFQQWRKHISSQQHDEERCRLLRSLLCDLPGKLAIIAIVAWLPQTVFYPLGLTLLAKTPASAAIWGHFAIDLTLSCLIALTYSVLASQWVILHFFYQRLWAVPCNVGLTASAELSDVEPRVNRLQIFAGLIPLAGAMLLVGVNSETTSFAFRALVIALIAFGMVGFQVAVYSRRLIMKTVSAFCDV